MTEFVPFNKTAEQLRVYAERGISKRISAGEMTKEDADLIKLFTSNLRATADISETRAYKVTNTLSCVCRFFKTPLSQNTILDIYAGIEDLKNADKTLFRNMNSKGKLSPNTIQDYVKQTKRFYCWLIDEGFCTTINKDKLMKIKNPSGNKMTKTADMLLSVEDINKMLSVCNNIRHKALISTLYESGCRIHEICRLKWSDITFDTHFAKLTTNGKTGQVRTIPLTASRQYLIELKNSQPNADNNSPVFITEAGTSYTYPFIKKTLSRIAERAGIEKHITPHIFRHSRITELIRADVPQSVVSRMAWGTVDSDMFGTYLHLTDTDAERELAKLAGIELEEQSEVDTFKPRTCPRCLHVNQPNNNFCSVCGAPLNEQTAIELESMKTEIHADSNYEIMLAELTQKLNALQSMMKT